MVSNLLWIMIFLSLVTGFASLYNAHFRYRILNMIKWLEEQRNHIAQENEYQKEYETLDEDILVLKQWSSESVSYGRAIFAVQFVNILLIFLTLLNKEPYILYGIAAIGNAFHVVAFKVFRKRRYLAEGVCHGTKTILDAIDIQKQEE